MEELSSDASAYAAQRGVLRAIFTETLEAIDVRAVIKRTVSSGDGMLHIADWTYPLADFRRIIVVAIGKAASPSAEVLLRQISACKPYEVQLQAIVVGLEETGSEACAIEHWPGSHPIPDATSRSAALRIIDVLRGTTAQDLVLFLISGGASAMVELPLDESMSVEEVAGFYRALVHSGLTIAEMNTLRKHLSAVKGGRLAQFAAHATKCTLLISDVPDEMDDVIGSGPTLPDPSTCEQCWQLMRRSQLKAIPQRVRNALESAALAETPKRDMECFRNAQYRVLLSTTTMLTAAAAVCARYGFHAVVDNTCDDWDYRDAAEYLLERTHELSREHPRMCLLSGGEVSVQLSGRPGRGGRNQQFALYCARLLQGRADAVSVLSAGTDGIDGNSPAAGAIVDATTVARARELQLDVQDALDRFDAYSLLDRIGDAIVTGATGNNVRDLRIVMAVRDEPNQDFDETGAR